jgi:hypothetical protein
MRRCIGLRSTSACIIAVSVLAARAESRATASATGEQDDQIVQTSNARDAQGNWRAAVIVEAPPESPAAPQALAFDRVKYVFGRESPLLIRAHGIGSVQPAITLSVAGWTGRGEVMTPTRMVMTRPLNQQSVMALLSVNRRRRSLSPGIFARSSLGAIAEEIEPRAAIETALER